jgi:hypothetical protein
VILFLIGVSRVYGQYIDTAQEPPGINWKTIESANFEIIFPDEITGEALRLATLLDSVAGPMAKTMQYRFKKIPLLLTTSGIIPNGYVTMAPRRSEWFGAPILNGSYDEDWYEFLASHELRHVAQFDKLLGRGLNRILGFVSGEQLISAWNSLLVPRWFWEGDAVAMETALGRGGRGRHPEFNMGIRAELLSGERPTYFQSVLGSFSKYTPGPYELGYHLVTHVRRQNGGLVWSNVLGRSSFFIFYPFAFTASARGVIKRSVPKIYNDSMNELERLWKAQLDKTSITPAEIINRRNDQIPTDYLFPHVQEDGSTLALRQGYADPPMLTLIDRQGVETDIKQIFYLYGISSQAGKVVWDEPSADTRWTKQSYSDIVLLDLKSRDQRWLTHHGRYFTPALSSDGKRIVAVEFTDQRESGLVIINSETGTVEKRITHPDYDLIKMPSWSEDGLRIVFANQGLQGKGLSIYDLETDSIREILPYCWQGISQPVFYRDYILYHTFASGMDNIFAVHSRSSQIYQVTSRPFGAFNPNISAGGDMLCFNDYSKNGYDIAIMRLDSSSWIEQDSIKNTEPQYFKPMIDQEQSRPLFGNGAKPPATYPAQDYHPAAHLFNFHSWYISPNFYNPGIYLVSNDLLNTMALGSGVYYNINEKKPGIEVQAGYGGLYPLINLNMIYCGREFYYTDAYNKSITDEWWERTMQAGVSLPFILSSGVNTQSLVFSVTAATTKISGQDTLLSSDTKNGNFYPVAYTFQYRRIRRYAYRDLQPRWGQTLGLYYYHTPFKGDYTGNLAGGQLKLYFPGLFRHHGLAVSGGVEIQRPNNYQFLSQVLFTRGYHYRFHEQSIATNIDYKFPLFYPDFSLGGLFYLKRVKLNLFNDINWTKNNGDKSRYHSAGFELTLDHHWFSWPFMLEGGYRYSYRFADKQPFSELVFQLPLDN